MGYANPFTDPYHLREYDEEELKAIVVKNGFEIVRVETEGFLIPIVDKFFTFLVLYLRLSKPVNFLAKLFPNRSLSIVVTALKK